MIVAILLLHQNQNTVFENGCSFLERKKPICKILLNIGQQLKLLRVMSRAALRSIPLGYCAKLELTAVAFLLLPYALTNFANRRMCMTDYQLPLDVVFWVDNLIISFLRFYLLIL